MIELRVFADADGLDAAAAEHIAAAAQRAIAERGRFLLVLAGGTTPRGVYRLLAAPGGERIDWDRVHLFWGDERCVAPDHPQSNYRMAAELLLNVVGVPTGNVHRIRGEEPPERAAKRFDEELAAFFGAPTPHRLGAKPAFDLVLLGIGEDGHTASLFPASSTLTEPGWAASARAPEWSDVVDRVTLTLPAINSARACLFLVVGGGKSAVVHQILRPSLDADRGASLLPAARVHPHDGNVWFVDADAAGLLKGGGASRG